MPQGKYTKGINKINQHKDNPKYDVGSKTENNLIIIIPSLI